jgi:hypothetical protein
MDLRLMGSGQSDRGRPKRWSGPGSRGGDARRITLSAADDGAERDRRRHAQPMMETRSRALADRIRTTST